MSADHKRPLLAFVLVMIACLLIVVNAARSQAVRSVLYDSAQRVAAGVALALDDDPAPATAAPTSFDRDDEHASASRRLPAATILLPAPQVALSSAFASAFASSVVAAKHPAPAHRHQTTSRPHRAAKAGHHRRATAVEHGARTAERSSHARTSGHSPRARAVGHGVARVAAHRSPAHASAGHRTSSRPSHARARARARAHHRSQHASHHRSGRHHRR